ncbi:MAG: ATP-dependent helicase [Lachnospiraceae bacterium]
MASFNEEQKRAITHKDGPMLVLAGPGSGKTLVITYRTRWLIEYAGVNPSNILVVTFTKAAAKEMKERFNRLTGQSLPVSFGTFHSIFFSILRYAYGLTGDNILREEKKRQFLTEIIHSMDLEIDEENDFISSVVGEISLVKGEMMNLEYYHSNSCADDIFCNIYRAYDEKLRRERLLDFDDMLVFCYELFDQRPDILKIWQNKFQYILVDEFQDINKIQFAIIQMLAKPRNNLFIVGDDDQSIYQFRGAKPEIMLGFESEYKECKKVILDINYRSSTDIVECAKRLIENNEKRFQKEIKANSPNFCPVDIRSFQTQREENLKMIELIRQYAKDGIPYQEMAVIFRTNIQPGTLIRALMEYNLPFQVKDGIPNIYDHWIAKNLLTYMEVALGSRERAKILSIINRPNRYVKRDMLKAPVIDLRDIAYKMTDKPWMVQRILDFIKDLDMIKDMPPYAAITYIRNVIGYDKYLREYAEFRRINVDELFDVIQEIQESAKEFDTILEFFKHIKMYGEELKRQKQEEKQEKNRIVLTTMHSAKGLEYEVVFVPEVNEGVIPHKKAVKDAEIEEERRLFYVALTRAKKYLHVFTVKELFHKEIAPSLFLPEISFDSESFIVGARVRHPKYGVGTITYLDSKKAKVLFEKHGTKSFHIDFIKKYGSLQIERN